MKTENFISYCGHKWVCAGDISLQGVKKKTLSSWDSQKYYGQRKMISPWNRMTTLYVIIIINA